MSGHAPTTTAAPKAAKKEFPYISAIVLIVLAAFVGAFANERFRFDQGLLPNVDMTQRVVYEAREGLNQGLQERLGKNVQETVRQNPDEVFRVRTELDKHELRSGVLENNFSKSPQAGASYGSANLEEFRVINSDPTAGEYEFQLDARVVWQPTGVFVEGGDTVEIQAEGTICSPPSPCNGPNGQNGLAKTAQVSPDHFPAGEAQFRALVYRFGEGDPRQAGVSRVTTAPSGKHELKLMANIRQPFIHEATGGFRVKIRIKKAGVS